jgi:hypothetical protein
VVVAAPGGSVDAVYGELVTGASGVGVPARC